MRLKLAKPLVRVEGLTDDPGLLVWNHWISRRDRMERHRERLENAHIVSETEDGITIGVYGLEAWALAMGGN